MTTLREAAQQALEAMRCAVPTGKITLTDWYKSITALRAALAEPVQEPVACSNTFGCRCPKHFTAEPVQEPVAWMYTGIKQDGAKHGPHLVWRPAYMDAMSASKGAQATPLYAAPPQRKPLTEEEKRALADKFLSCQPESYEVSGVFDLISAIERAHEIGGSNE